MNSYHRVHFLVLVFSMTAFSVLASQAFALLRTLETSAKTLAVFLLALRLFASAFPHGDEGRYVLEEARIAVIGYLFGLINLVLIFWLVSATYTNTVFVASHSSRETFAVKFQTVYFGTFTALILSFLFDFHHCWSNIWETFCWHSRGICLVQKFFEKVRISKILCDHCLNLGWVVEFVLHELEFR